MNKLRIEDTMALKRPNLIMFIPNIIDTNIRITILNFILIPIQKKPSGGLHYLSVLFDHDRSLLKPPTRQGRFKMRVPAHSHQS